MKGRRRKIITRIIVFLLLGAIVNVAVAWVYYLRRSTSGFTNNSVATIHGGTESWTGLFRKVEFDPPSQTKYSILNRSGWPLLAAESFTTVDFSGTIPSTQTLSGIVLQPHRGTWPSIRYPKVVPLKPHFPGFAINTIFYAAILWLLFFTPGSVRRAIRRRRGLCPACAYPVGTSPVCTECGKPVWSHKSARA